MKPVFVVLLVILVVGSAFYAIRGNDDDAESRGNNPTVATFIEATPQTFDTEGKITSYRVSWNPPVFGTYQLTVTIRGQDNAVLREAQVTATYTSTSRQEIEVPINPPVDSKTVGNVGVGYKQQK